LDPAAGESAAWIIRRHDVSNHSRINLQLQGCIDYKTAKKLARNLRALEHRLPAPSSTLIPQAFVIYRYFLTNKQL